MNPASVISLAGDWLFGEGSFSINRIVLVRGVVDHNRDPQHRGRVLVRILEDGPEMGIEDPTKPRVSTFELDWCTPMFSQGGGMGFGAFNVPYVGAKVFVLHERGVATNPVYFGGWIANPSKRKRYGVTKTTLETPVKHDEDEVGYGPDEQHRFPPRPVEYHNWWEEQQGPELPLEARQMEDHTPDTQVMFKTYKGASMVVKERDEDEEVILTDRLGAELRFESHVSRVKLEEGEDPVATPLQIIRRKLGSGTQQESFGAGAAYNGEHRVRLVNAGGAGLDIHVNAAVASRATLQSHSGYDTAIDSAADKAAIQLDQGEKKVTLVLKESGVDKGRIEIDAVGSIIKVTGLQNVEVRADSDIVLVAPNIRIKGNVTLDGEFRHTSPDQLTLVNNKMNPFKSPVTNLSSLSNINIPSFEPDSQRFINDADFNRD